VLLFFLFTLFSMFICLFVTSTSYCQINPSFSIYC